MSDLGIAVIGLGMGVAHLSAINELGGARVVALCDSDPGYLERCASQVHPELATTDYLEAVAHPSADVVLIATPDEFHAPMTIAACEASKQVLVEKPMARNIAECEAMVAAVRRSGVTLTVGHVCRFYPLFAQIRRWTEDSTLGTPYYIETSYIHNYEFIGGAGGWRFDPHKRHPFVGGACHAVDLARWLGGEITQVHALGNHFNAPWQAWEDHIIVNARFAGGAVGRIMNSSGPVHPYNIECEVWGTEGTIKADNTSSTAKLCLRRIGREVWMEYPTDGAAKPVAGELVHFLDCVRGGKQPLIDAIDGARTIAVCEAVIESLCTGEPVAPRLDF